MARVCQRVCVCECMLKCGMMLQIVINIRFMLPLSLLIRAEFKGRAVGLTPSSSEAIVIRSRHPPTSVLGAHRSPSRDPAR